MLDNMIRVNSKAYKENAAIPGPSKVQQKTTIVSNFEAQKIHQNMRKRQYSDA